MRFDNEYVETFYLLSGEEEYVVPNTKRVANPGSEKTELCGIARFDFFAI